MRVMILLMFLISAAHAQSAAKDTSAFRITVEGGVGYSFRISSAKLPLGDEQRSGPAASFRLKWGSGRVVNVGLESGWFSVSSLETTLSTPEFGSVSISSSISAVPVIGFISIQHFGVEASAGLGYYFVSSATTVMGTAMESSEWDLGYLLSIGYSVPFTPEWNIIGTIRWNNIAEQQISVASFQAQVQYRLY
jgi:hypothetical protein